MKKPIFLSFFLTSTLLVLQTTSLMAQDNKFSQNNAEKEANIKYEAANPPKPTMAMPSPGENEAFFGARLTRSTTLLETSTKSLRNPVKVLIYGQSITGSKIFTDDMADYLKNKFPYADITLENRSIGGFGGEQIIRTAVHDVYPFYPDLIIFHVYGGEKAGELEQLFSNIRRYTTADILLMSHTLNATQTKTEENSAKYMRFIANKYDCELADISYEWPKYVAENNLKPTDLLRDGVHPNRNGNWVMVQLVGRHIRFNTLYPSAWYKSVRSYFAGLALDKGVSNPITFTGKDWKTNAGAMISETKENTMKFSFTGNRVDVIAGHPLKLTQAGTATVLLDGKAIDNGNTIYTITRPSPGAGTWWPAIRQINHTKPLITEDWTLIVDDINADSTIYTYHVKGSKTGEDGTGKSNELFISKTGRVVIQADDVMFVRIQKTFKVATPKGFEVKWSAMPLYNGTYIAPITADRTKIYKTTLLQGISNGSHSLEIIPNGDGPISIESFEVYEPELK